MANKKSLFRLLSLILITSMLMTVCVSLASCSTQNENTQDNTVTEENGSSTPVDGEQTTNTDTPSDVTDTEGGSENITEEGTSEGSTTEDTVDRG